MVSYGPADEGPADEGPADEGLDHEASLDGEQVRFGLTVAEPAVVPAPAEVRHQVLRPGGWSGSP